VFFKSKVTNWKSLIKTVVIVIGQKGSIKNSLNKKTKKTKKSTASPQIMEGI